MRQRTRKETHLTYSSKTQAKTQAKRQPPITEKEQPPNNIFISHTMDITHSNHSLWLHCSIATLPVRHRPTTSETKCDEQTEGHQIWQFPSIYRRHHLQHPDYIYNHPTSYTTMKPWRTMIEEVDWTPPSTWFGNATNNEKRQQSRGAKGVDSPNQEGPSTNISHTQWMKKLNEQVPTPKELAKGRTKIPGWSMVKGDTTSQWPGWGGWGKLNGTIVFTATRTRSPTQSPSP